MSYEYTILWHIVNLLLIIHVNSRIIPPGNNNRRGADVMTKLELLTVLYSLDTLMEKKDLDAAHSVVKRIIAEAEKRPQDRKSDNE